MTGGRPHEPLLAQLRRIGDDLGGFAAEMSLGAFFFRCNFRGTIEDFAMVAKLLLGRFMVLDDSQTHTLPIPAGRYCLRAPCKRVATKPHRADQAPTSSRATGFVSVPMPSIVMETTSPSASVKSSGGTMPVPVIRNAPSGWALPRKR